MVSFIICDDNKKINQSINEIVDQTMMKNKIPYRKMSFLDYNAEFMHVMNDKLPNKIYILDIETPTTSGIDIVRRIREKDFNSIIIFLTSHDELGYTILKQEFMFLAFICKFDDYKNKLAQAIKKALQIVGQKRILNINDKGVVYNIPMDDILYITRDSVDRKCVIKTEYTEFRVNKSLTAIFDELSDKFKYSHRACIVNMKRVRIIDKKNKEIVFDTKTKIDLINDEFKKGLVLPQVVKVVE